jgi:hypothetical protein
VREAVRVSHVGKDKSAYRDFVRKHEEKGQVGRHRRRRVDNIEVHIKEYDRMV